MVLFDSGACQNVVSRNFINRLNIKYTPIHDPSQNLTTATGEQVLICGKATISVHLSKTNPPPGH